MDRKQSSLLPLRAFIKIPHRRPTQHMSCMNYRKDLALLKSDIIAWEKIMDVEQGLVLHQLLAWEDATVGETTFKAYITG